MILLDTQVVMWLTLERSKLSARAEAAIRKSMKNGRGIAISDKTLWEIAMAVTRRRIVLPSSLRDYLKHIEALCSILPIDAGVAARSIEFKESFPSDPSDRIIAATALVHSLPLITADKAILESGEVPCIW